jgi:ribonuclease VapC
VNLFDASALLCFLRDEAGAAVVERELLAGGACSAVNWSETAQKLVARGQDWALARGVLLSYGLVIEPVSADDAERAAHLWRHGSGLSLADRIALATAHRLAATIWTADTAWGTDAPVRQVR